MIGLCFFLLSSCFFLPRPFNKFLLPCTAKAYCNQRESKAEVPTIVGIWAEHSGAGLARVVGCLGRRGLCTVPFFPLRRIDSSAYYRSEASPLIRTNRTSSDAPVRPAFDRSKASSIIGTNGASLLKFFLPIRSGGSRQVQNRPIGRLGTCPVYLYSLRPPLIPRRGIEGAEKNTGGRLFHTAHGTCMMEPFPPDRIGGTDPRTHRPQQSPCRPKLTTTFHKVRSCDAGTAASETGWT